MADYKTGLHVPGFSLQDCYNHHHRVTLCLQCLFVKSRWFTPVAVLHSPYKRILTSSQLLRDRGSSELFYSHVLRKLGQTSRSSDKKQFIFHLRNYNSCEVSMRTVR